MKMQLIPAKKVMRGAEFKAWAEEVRKIYFGVYSNLSTDVDNVKSMAGFILGRFGDMKDNRLYIITDIQYDNEGCIKFVWIRKYPRMLE